MFQYWLVWVVGFRLGGRRGGVCGRSGFTYVGVGVVVVVVVAVVVSAVVVGDVGVLATVQLLFLSTPLYSVVVFVSSFIICSCSDELYILFLFFVLLITPFEVVGVNSFMVCSC